MPNIQAKDATEATIYLYSTKANSNETPAVSQENLLDALEPQTNTTAPSTDTAAAGINGRLIRLAQRLTSLIALLPASLGQANMAGSLSVTVASNQSAVPVSGPLTDAELRATAVPVSGPLTAAQLTTAALATDSVSQAIRDRLPSALAGGRLNVEPLGVPGVARQLAAGSASGNTALTVGVSRISIYASGADIRYAIGSSAQTASSTSHYIAAGERLDFDVPGTPNIAVIRAGSTDGTLELTELS